MDNGSTELNRTERAGSAFLLKASHENRIASSGKRLIPVSVLSNLGPFLQNSCGPKAQPESGPRSGIRRGTKERFSVRVKRQNQSDPARKVLWTTFRLSRRSRDCQFQRSEPGQKRVIMECGAERGFSFVRVTPTPRDARLIQSRMVLLSS